MDKIIEFGTEIVNRKEKMMSIELLKKFCAEKFNLSDIEITTVRTAKLHMTVNVKILKSTKKSHISSCAIKIDLDELQEWMTNHE